MLVFKEMCSYHYSKFILSQNKKLHELALKFAYINNIEHENKILELVDEFAKTFACLTNEFILIRKRFQKKITK